MEIINLERKNEYTAYLVNILAPIIYDGILSIYNDGINICNENEELKTFQTLLKTIPSWSNYILSNEVNRIKIVSKCDFIDDLIKGVFKANITILSDNNYIDEKYYNIDIDKFIHICYISIAKELYQIPDLLYHNNKTIDLKRNQRETINLIKEAIRNTIRKLIPIDIILKNYLSPIPKQKQILINNDIKQTLQNDLEENLNNSYENFKTNIETQLKGGNINMKKIDMKAKLVSEEVINKLTENEKSITDTNSIINKLKKNILYSSDNNAKTICNENEETSISYNNEEAKAHYTFSNHI